MIFSSSRVFSRSARMLEEMPSSDFVNSSRKCRRLPNIMSRMMSRLHLSPSTSSERLIGQLNAAGGLLFSRVTYEVMANHWPSATGEVADLMNAAPKYVFSRTVKKSGWNNTQMFGADVPETVARLKRDCAKDIFLFGSADLAGSLIPHGLIDEFRIAVNPIILGGGTPLFKPGEKIKLKLIDSRPLTTGIVILRYAPAPK